MGDTTIFLTPNANRQVEIAEGDRAKMAFASHHELLQFIGIMFGWQNGPGPFQPEMHVTSFTVICQVALVYLDGVGIFSKSP